MNQQSSTICGINSQPAINASMAAISCNSVSVSTRNQQTLDDELTKPTVANGLAAVGSAFGLIYGIKEKKRWWMVLLFMLAGATAGRGVGYVIESGSNNK